MWQNTILDLYEQIMEIINLIILFLIFQFNLISIDLKP